MVRIRVSGSGVVALYVPDPGVSWLPDTPWVVVNVPPQERREWSSRMLSDRYVASWTEFIPRGDGAVDRARSHWEAAKGLVRKWRQRNALLGFEVDELKRQLAEEVADRRELEAELSEFRVGEAA